MPELRYFTSEGRAHWSKWVTTLRADHAASFPEGLLGNRDLTRLAPGAISIDAHNFALRFELAQTLAPVIENLRNQRLSADRWPGVWDWLAAFYFESICPASAAGNRSPGEQARYCFEPDNFRRRYRHRIFGPVDLYSRYGDSSRLVIHGDPSTVSDWEEQVASRYQISANRGIADALFLLYWDPAKMAPKRGAAPNKKTPGTLRRFSDLVQQFDRTYDLSSIGAQAIIDLLPSEFKGFKPRPPKTSSPQAI